MTRSLLAFFAATTVLLGVWALFVPAGLADAVGYDLTNHSAHTEVRATYGGLMLTLGGGMFVGVVRPIHLRASLWLAALTFGGFGLGRAIGLVLDGPWESVQPYIFAFEVVATAACAFLLTRTPEDP